MGLLFTMKSFKRSTLLLGNLISLLIFGLAQELPAQSIINNQTEIQHLSRMLSNNTVTSIYQDDRGFMWFGTFNGLNKYDGVNVNMYYADADDKNSLSDYYINKITGDHLGNVWVCTKNGLNRYNLDYDNFIQYKYKPGETKSITSGSITDALCDSENRLWIFGDNISLYNYENDNFKNFIITEENSELERADSYNHIFEDNKGRVWFLNHRKIYYYDSEAEKVQLFFDGNKHNLSYDNWYFMHIVQLNDERFLISSNNAGVFEVFPYKNNELQPFVFGGIITSELRGVQILQFRKDSQGRVWLTAENKGVYVFNIQAELIMRLTHDRDNDQTIANNSIWSVYEDEAKRIWLGTWQSGVDIIDKYYRKFKHYYYRPGTNSLSHNNVKDVIEDKEGNLYVSTDGGGLNYFDREKGVFKAYKKEPGNPSSLSANAVLPLEYDDNGHLWMGTWNGGINVFNPTTQRFRHINPLNSGLNSPHVFDIVNDGKGKMYCATWGGGLSSYNQKTGRWKTFRHDAQNPASICSDYIFSLFFDSDSNLWIGTTNGLDVLNTASDKNPVFIHYTHNENDSSSLSNNTINTIYEDRDKQIWVGTTAGLNRYMPISDNFIRYDKSTGLIDDNIYIIVQDKNADYWLGTNKGLIRFNARKNTSGNYDISDGMQCYEYSRNAYTELSSGEIALGGTKGLNVFNPDNIRENPYIPNLLLTGLKIHNEPVQVGKNSVLQQHISKTDKITLNHKQNIFSLEFVALNYTHPSENQYAYKLEGFDDDWNYINNRQQVTYTNLSPGEYTFKLKASNNDGLWTKEPLALHIEILPPWWGTTIFRIVFILLIAAVIYLFVRQRMKKEKKARQILEAKVKEATEDIKSRNEDLSKAQKKITSIIDNVKDQLVGASNQLLDSSNNQSATAEEISSSVEMMVGDMTRNSQETKSMSEKAKKVQTEALKNAEAIENAVSFLNRISEAISVIFDISFQTQILSLNASIEAAKAGEHGSGFSVIAKEIKKLSEHSQSEAQKIIDMSSKGLKLSNEANKTVSELTGFIEHITELIDKISTSSQEQSNKAEDINRAVREMTKYIEQTSQSVHDLDSAIKSLAVTEAS
jgi:ligand-binding sensor domain-containing protein/methyl-accepting chemotaxis protein